MSSRSRSSSFSPAMKEQAIEEKMRLTDLMAESSYMKQKKLQEIATEQLKIKIEIEEANVRAMEIEQAKSRAKIRNRGA